jgi:hypothetical protein
MSRRRAQRDMTEGQCARCNGWSVLRRGWVKGSGPHEPCPACPKYLIAQLPCHVTIYRLLGPSARYHHPHCRYFDTEDSRDGCIGRGLWG